MQLELDFDAIPGVVRLSPYLRPTSKRRCARAVAAVVAFPLSRQRSTIQDVALQFKSKRGKKRSQFWHETIARLRIELRATGMKEDAITRQLVAFRDAVEREMSSGRDDPKYGGAA